MLVSQKDLGRMRVQKPCCSTQQQYGEGDRSVWSLAKAVTKKRGDGHLGKFGRSPWEAESDHSCACTITAFVGVSCTRESDNNAGFRHALSLILLLLRRASGEFGFSRVESAGREINVAAAADLSSALQEIAANYEKRTGVVVKLSFGSSGALTQQIQNGAPFDVFFSADMDYPRQLIAGGDKARCNVVSLCHRAVGALGSERFSA